jgi:hypothetical protein
LVIDSGSTFSYFETHAFNALKAALRAKASPVFGGSAASI